MAYYSIEVISGILSLWRQCKCSLEHEVEAWVITYDSTVEGLFCNRSCAGYAAIVISVDVKFVYDYRVDLCVCPYLSFSDLRFDSGPERCLTDYICTDDASQVQILSLRCSADVYRLVFCNDAFKADCSRHRTYLGRKSCVDLHVIHQTVYLCIQ